MSNLTKKLKFTAFSMLISSSLVYNAHAASQIRVVGSSTVYPFITVVSEHFGRNSKNSTPIVESTGTGGGFKLFCAGGEASPDIANASRPMTDSEKKLCNANKVESFTEIKIGYDGIVVANDKKAPKITLTLKQLFLGLAAKVPVKGQLVANPYKTWNDVDKSLPANKIEVYGPPPTSGTRDAFVELVMDKTCEQIPEFKTAIKDDAQRKLACKVIREDGSYIDAGENDNLIVQKLKNNDKALGIFGYSFLEQNGGVVQGSSVDGVDPTFDTILKGSYPVSRPLFVYVNNSHLSSTLGLKDFVKELVSKKAMGKDGYLVEKGLIPLSESEFSAVKKIADGITK